ncbi:MAG: glycoside hydrolase family [Desulfobulbaceae bacterium]|nr:MAG: glycoside hydrolase family [Desulfobulbaceae bacterium]
MNNGSARKILFVSLAGLVTALLALLLLTPFSLLAVGQTDASSDGTQQNVPNLQLRVDAYNHARAFCNGMKVVVSFADFIEFFVLNMDGSRHRIYSGPWKGKLKEDSPGHYTLTGTDPASGLTYSLGYHQVDLNTVEIEMVYKAPSRPANIGFDIVKLSPDLLKGAALEVFPPARGDAEKIPVQPTPFADRVLLENKSRVLIKSVLCDIEISELGESSSMLLADGRNMPWDKEKSIYFIGGKDRLVPGQTYSFRYSIRSLPPTGHVVLPKGQTDEISAPNIRHLSLSEAASDKALPAASIAPEKNSWSFYALPPKEEIKKDGRYVLQSQDGIYGVTTGTAETILAREIEELTSLRLPVKAAAQGNTGRGLYIERISHEDGSHLPAEGFEIVTTPDKVTVRGGSERACLYGIYTVLGRLSRVNDWQLKCGTLRDWPDLPVRGVCIAMSNSGLRDVKLMKGYLDAFSRARSNVVIFLHDPLRIRSWQKNVDDGGWTKEQMQEISLYARSLEMDIWGGMGSGFKADQFPEINISKDSNLYNPFEESSYTYLFALYSELLEVYHPSTLLIGHDEIQGLSAYAAQSGRSVADILSMDVRKIHDWLTPQNVKTAMWGDMLLDFTVWDKDVGAANSRNPAFNSGATHLAITQIPSDVLILDWHYDEKKDFRSIGYFRQNGFSATGCPWHNPYAARTLAKSAKKYGGSGVIATDWGFLGTFSPAATTLYAPLCAWSTDCVIGTDNRDVSALAETMRPRGYDGALTGYSQLAVGLEDVGNASTSGIFGLGNVLGLPAVLSQQQKTDAITFDILSDKDGKTLNCVVVENKNGKLPKGKVVYQGGQPARVLAFLHTSLIEEPQVRSRRVGCYLVEYENGQTETISLMENWNITDIRSSEGLRRNDWTFIRSPDVLIGSQLGWRGLSGANVPLNLQMFTWRNPHPEQKISSIRLLVDAVPSNSKIALIGLTFLQ